MKIDSPPGHPPTLVALPLIFLSLVALAQAPSRTPTEKGRIRVEVNLVNVIASVADKKGRPVPDLPKEEFEIYEEGDRKSTRLNSSHGYISYAVFCLKK